ncbi:unnamed protein product, partial [Bubo scandiacus]
MPAIAASPESIRMEKSTKPNQNVNKKKVLHVKFKRHLLKLPGVHSLRKNSLKKKKKKKKKRGLNKKKNKKKKKRGNPKKKKKKKKKKKER